MSALENYKKKKENRLEDAALVGAGLTGSLAGYESLTDYIRNKKENESVKGSRSWADFQKKLQPGDVVFHRRPHKFSGTADLGPFEFPFKEADVMMATKGDPFYHSSIYKGKGLVTDASGFEHGTKDTRLKSSIPEELKVYRPKVAASEKEKALKFLEQMKGAPYKDEKGAIEHGARHMLGQKIKTGKTPICSLKKNGIVCTELTSEAYPKVFKDRLASPKDMRASKDLQLIARYAKTSPLGVREMLMSNVAYPLLKNSKWGALAGAAALGGLALSDQFSSEEDSALEKWKKRKEA